MNHKGYLLLLFCPLLAGARDPFLPVEDRCQTTQLTQCDTAAELAVRRCGWALFRSTPVSGGVYEATMFCLAVGEFDS